MAAEHASFSDRQGHSTVVFHDSIWVIGGNTPSTGTYYNETWRSDNGVSWTRVTSHAAFGKRAGHESVVFNDKIWVIGGRDGATLDPLNDVWYSSDGLTWTQATASAPFAPRWDFGLTVSDGRMWVIGGSEDGITHNDVWYSTDGITWTRATQHAGFSPRMEPSAIEYDGKIWVTGGFNWNQHFNDLWYSEDGATWTKVTDHASYPARRYQQMEVADGKMWVIGGIGGDNPYNWKYLTDVWYSADGTHWTRATADTGFPGRYSFTSAVFKNKLWVIAGTTGNDVWYSCLEAVPPEEPGDLGTVWTQATEHAQFSDRRQAHSSIVFNDKLWVIGGWGGDYSCPGNSCYDDVWSSDDGVQWTQVTEHAAFGPRGGHRSLVFDNRMWVIGGRDLGTWDPLNDVWYSSDGIHWTRAVGHAPFVPRWDFGTTVFNGEMWVIGGSNDGPVYSDVWHSSDGKNWERATAAAGFTPRMDLTATSFKGKIWVTGGFDWSKHFNDLWSSEDGVSWTKVTDHAAYPERRYHTTAVADGKMWVIGGIGGDNPYNWKYLTDVWYSADGTTWTRATADTGFPGRYDFSSAVFKDRLWVIAGTSGNDVWYSGKMVAPTSVHADFKANPVLGTAPLNVQFTDTSASGTSEIIAWTWSFDVKNKGGFSNEENPYHTYTKAGTYTVSLTASDAGGSDTEVRTAFITVTKPHPEKLIGQLITYTNKQKKIPKFYRKFMVGELLDAKRSLLQNHPDIAVLEMKFFKLSVNVLEGKVLREEQVTTMQDTADAIINAMDQP